MGPQKLFGGSQFGNVCHKLLSLSTTLLVSNFVVVVVFVVMNILNTKSPPKKHTKKLK